MDIYVVKKILINSFEDIIKDTVEKIDKDVQEGVVQHKTNKIISIDEKLLPLKTSIVKEGDKNIFLKVNSIIGKSTWIYSMKHLLAKTYKVLDNVSWCIYDAPKYFEWITLDDPVVFLNYYGKNKYDFNGRWASKNTNIIFPLSPKKLLFEQIGGIEQNALYKKASVDFAIQIQKFIIENAFLKVYSFKEDNMVCSIRNRVVNRKEFLRIKKEMEQIHENYMNDELLYIK